MNPSFSKSIRLCQITLLALPLTLGACAPSATSGAATAVTNSARAPLDLAAGQSAEVSLRFSPDDFQVDTSQEKELDIDFNNKDGLGRVQDKEIPVSWFSVTDTTPAQWTVRGESGFYGYTIVKTQDNGSGGTSGVRYRNYVRLVLRVTAPAGAAAGPAVLMLKVRNVNGKTGEVPVYVNVRK